MKSLIRITIYTILLLAAVLLGACSSTDQGNTNAPESPSEIPINWKLDGIWVDESGAVIAGQESVPLTLEGILPSDYKATKVVNVALDFSLANGTIEQDSNSQASIIHLHANYASKHENQHIFHGVASFLETGKDKPISIDFHVCLEDQFVVIHFADENKYLIATGDKVVDYEKILAFWEEYVGNAALSTSNSDDSIEVSWNMPAYWVDANGNVLEVLELSATGDIIKHHNYTDLDAG